MYLHRTGAGDLQPFIFTVDPPHTANDPKARQAFATRFPLEIFTRIITRISWKHRRLIWEKESIRNKPFARVSLGGKNKTAQGLLFLGCMRTDHTLVSVHGLQAGVLSIDDSIGNWYLEPLETQHLLLKGAHTWWDSERSPLSFDPNGALCSLPTRAESYYSISEHCLKKHYTEHCLKKTLHDFEISRQIV